MRDVQTIELICCDRMLLAESRPVLVIVVREVVAVNHGEASIPPKLIGVGPAVRASERLHKNLWGCDLGLHGYPPMTRRFSTQPFIFCTSACSLPPPGSS